MRKTVLIAGIALLFLNKPDLRAQASLNWASSFSPSWSNGSTSGTAINVGGTSINCTATATITGGGSYMLALGSSGAQTPTVSGSTFTVPGTTNRLQVTPNYTSNASYTDIVLAFTALATNVSFNIVDIDKNNANSSTYFDQVTVTGSDGTNTYNATLSKYDAVTDPNFLMISGNIAYVNTNNGQAGNTASDAADQRGSVTVSFGATSLSSIKIRYNNAAGANANPASQAIAIGSVSFSASTLPVSLTAFSGHRQLQDVVLDWTTQQEINAASFDIERNSGSNWETIGSVTARGNSCSASDYTFTDTNPQGSLLLYRLKQIDIDGNYKYSNIIRITTKNTKTDIQSYPNPFTSQVNVSISSPAYQQVVIAVYDAGGKTVRAETKYLFAGNNNFTITGLDKLTRAVYYLEVKDAAGEILGRSKLVKD